MKKYAVLAAVAVIGLGALGPSGSAWAQEPQADTQTFTFGFGSRIGASVRDVRDADLPAAKLSRVEGVLVEAVDMGTPAARAGLRAGDIVLEFDGERVRSVRQFTRLVQDTPIGRAVPVVVTRAGTRQTLSVTPEVARFGGPNLDNLRERIERQMGSLPQGMGQRAGERRLGVTLTALSPQLAAYFGVKGGALVSEVAADSPASRANVKAGDVITAVAGHAVSSPAEVAAQIRASTSAGPVELTLMRDKREVKVQVRMDDAPARRRAPQGV